MNLVTEVLNFVSDLTDRASGSVHVASYTSKDSVTYVLSDDQTHVRLIVHHAEKRSTSESSTSTIAPSLAKKLIEDLQVASTEGHIDESMKGREG